MKEPRDLVFMMIGGILLLALIVAWLFTPAPKEKKAAYPSHVGVWESREKIHTHGEEENFFTHLIHQIEKDTKYKKGTWPSLQK